MTRNGQCFSFQHGNVSALNAMIKFQTSMQFKKRARHNLVHNIG